MNCHNCGRQIAEGSGFCPYCGVPQNKPNVPQQAPQRPVMPPVQPQPAPVQAAPAPPVPPITQAPPVTQMPPVMPVTQAPPVMPVPLVAQAAPAPQKPAKEAKPKGAKKPFPVLALILGLLLLAAIGLNVYQYILWDETNEQLIKADGILVNMKSELNQKSGEIAELREQVDFLDGYVMELEESAWVADHLRSIAEEGNFGYAADNFRTNAAIYVVDQNSTTDKLTLWANWPSGGTVYVDYLGEAAWVNFDQNSWKTSTTMTIAPEQPGISIVTFSNSIDSNTFSILLIVTE